MLSIDDDEPDDMPLEVSSDGGPVVSKPNEIAAEFEVELELEELEEEHDDECSASNDAGDIDLSDAPSSSSDMEEAFPFP